MLDPTARNNLRSERRPGENSASYAGVARAGECGEQELASPSHGERGGWISEPDPRCGGPRSAQGHAVSRIPSPTPPPAFTHELCSNSGTAGKGWDNFNPFRLKTQLLISFKTLVPNPKSESRGWGNSARWKTSGCYFWSAWGWSSGVLHSHLEPKVPETGGAEGLRIPGWG